MNKLQMTTGGEIYAIPTLNEHEIRVELGFAATRDQYSKPGSAGWADYGEGSNDLGEF